MRKLASFLLNYSGPEAGAAFTSAVDTLDGWVATKGTLNDGQCTMPSGALATVERNRVESSKGTLVEMVFTEPMSDGRFRTKVVVGRNEEQVVVGITLSAIADRMGPTFVDVRVPKLMRDLIDLGLPWKFGSTELRKTKLFLRGEAGGKEFMKLVFDPDRTIPVVAIAEESYGAMLHPDLCVRMAGDLAGISIVVHLDEEASWYVTNMRGKEWSCYAGAVRLYWPSVHDKDDPFRHPLWSPYKLMENASDTEHASVSLRAQLRRMIFSQAVFFITEPALFRSIHQAARQEERTKLIKEASSVEDYVALLEEADRQNAEIELERDDLRKQVADLEAQLEQFKVMEEYRRTGGDVIPPNVEQIPSTPEDALLIAADRFKEELVFGQDAFDEVSNLAPNAGPPEKILRHLEVLADLTKVRREGSIGVGVIQWLNGKGVTASIESETSRNSKKDQQSRTWDDGSGRSRCFDEHTKPSNQTSPDRCVRIYFQYDSGLGKTIVGYIGGKFGL